MVDNQHRPFGGMGYDSMNYHHPPHFTDPWAHSSASHTNPLYPTTLGPSSMSINGIPKQEPPRPTNISMPYSSIPVSAPSLVAGSSYSTTSGYGSQDVLSLPQGPTYGSEHNYSSASSVPSTYATSSTYNPLGYAQSLAQQQQQQQQHESSRRISPTGNGATRTSEPTYGDAIDASRGMVALSQTDLTPRNIYGRGSRDSTDSYGFPATHSSSSSISSASNYPYFGGSVAGSVDSSVTDYSSAASESGYEPMTSRTLPRPNNLMGGNMPPAPQSMMGQFSSKLSSNTQKKHKCKVCDKRFTRPSSLQTHMYSHTGEKPYACDVDGCGRHFSVVSNLRRHKKVHKGEQDPSSPDDE